MGNKLTRVNSTSLNRKGGKQEKPKTSYKNINCNYCNYADYSILRLQKYNLNLGE